MIQMRKKITNLIREKNYEYKAFLFWQRKSQAWKNIPLTIITPSKWLAECARSSSLFRNLPIEVIPNGVDLQRFKPVDRQLVRSLLNLPQNKQLILFGAVKATSDRRKGFYLLKAAQKMY